MWAKMWACGQKRGQEIVWDKSDSSFYLSNFFAAEDSE